MKKLPLGIQTFRDIIEDGYIYVDKTRHVYDLINGGKYYFLSRPRRFGKSLLLDTIAEAFSGDKELFKGLWIYDSDHEFIKHPTLRFDMSNIANDTPENLITSLSLSLNNRIRKEGFDINSKIPSDAFQYLIEALHDKYKQRVVILIDEYDKPLLDHIDDLETAEANRRVLRSFYGVLKSMDPNLRLTFITGVSKFSKTSIFSGLNNLMDITMTEDYADICGIAVDDLDVYFGEHISSLSALDKFKKHGSLHDGILSWYDGYSWDGASKLLNPFSLLSFLKQKRFSGFWYSTGSPKFLVDMIKKDPSVYTNMKNMKITESMLDMVDIDEIDAELLMFQTGYLTVKEVLHTQDECVYVLDLPNTEVRAALNFHMRKAEAFRQSAGGGDEADKRQGLRR